MRTCPSCGKPIGFWDRMWGDAKHDACAAHDADRDRELARQEEQARIKAEEEKRDRERMSRRRTNGLDRIVGQQDTVRRLRQFAALYPNEPPGHILLTGPDGIGKHTLAWAFAQEYCRKEVEIDGRTHGRQDIRSLVSLLTECGQGGAFIITNLHRLPRRQVAEFLISGLRDFAGDFVESHRGWSSMHNVSLKRFTCIATAPSEGKCQRELAEAFHLVLPMPGYSHEELAAICQRVAGQNGIFTTPAVAAFIARRCNGTPHHVELLVKRLAELGKSAKDEEEVAQTLSTLGLGTGPKSPNNGTASLDRLDALSGVDFEKLVANLLRHMGFEAVMTKASGDGGVDVVATLDQPVVGGRYLIQCKRFAVDNLVGAATVREFYGAVTADRQAVKGVFITTSDFTAQAREFARGLPIELIGGTQLSSLLSEHGLPTADNPGFRLSP